jgi:hypothetical protein
MLQLHFILSVLSQLCFRFPVWERGSSYTRRYARVLLLFRCKVNVLPLQVLRHLFSALGQTCLQRNDTMAVQDISTPATPAATTESEKQKHFASIIPENVNDNGRLELQRTASNIHHQDMPAVNFVVTGDTDEIYNRFSDRRKTVIVAVPEVAKEFGTDGSIINVSNALYMLFMGLSPCFYGPYGNIYGRKWVSG